MAYARSLVTRRINEICESQDLAADQFKCISLYRKEGNKYLWRQPVQIPAFLSLLSSLLATVERSVSYLESRLTQKRTRGPGRERKIFRLADQAARSCTVDDAFGPVSVVSRVTLERVPLLSRFPPLRPLRNSFTQTLR